MPAKNPNKATVEEVRETWQRLGDTASSRTVTAELRRMGRASNVTDTAKVARDHNLKSRRARGGGKRIIANYNKLLCQITRPELNERTAFAVVSAVAGLAEYLVRNRDRLISAGTADYIALFDLLTRSTATLIEHKVLPVDCPITGVTVPPVTALGGDAIKDTGAAFSAFMKAKMANGRSNGNGHA